MFVQRSQRRARISTGLINTTRSRRKGENHSDCAPASKPTPLQLFPLPAPLFYPSPIPYLGFAALPLGPQTPLEAPWECRAVCSAGLAEIMDVQIIFLEAFPEVFIWQAQAVGSMCCRELARFPSRQLFFRRGWAGAWLVTGPGEPGSVLFDSPPEHPVSLLWGSKLGLPCQTRIFSY